MNRVFIAIVSLFVLVSCGTNKGTDASLLEANTWKLLSIQGTTNDNFTMDDSFTINFSGKDSIYNGKGACNRFFGKFELKGKNDITIHPGGSTMMACPGMEMEQQFFSVLEKANRYTIKDSVLALYNKQEELATFKVYTNISDGHNAENALDYKGTYTGMFPDPLFLGKNVTLVLADDNQFSLSMESTDKNQDINLIIKGLYTVKGNILTLNYTGETLLYKVGENKLIKLDSNGEPLQGEQASKYILTKQ
ncbi:MAG: META domain-containing protein [Marinifilaceae bacterium]